MIGTGEFGPRSRMPQHIGQATGPGRRTHLIGHHRQLIALCHQAQHGLDEIRTKGRVNPGRTHDKRGRQALLHGLLTQQLAATVFPQRRCGRLGGIGRRSRAIENEIRRNMDQARSEIDTGGRQVRRSIRIDTVGLRYLGLRFIHRSIGSGVDDYLRRYIGKRALNSLRIANVQLRSGQGYTLHRRSGATRQLPAQLSTGTRDHNLLFHSLSFLVTDLVDRRTRLRWFPLQPDVRLGALHLHGASHAELPQTSPKNALGQNRVYHVYSTSNATHPLPGSTLDLRLVAVASLLLSLWLIIIDPLINRDAIIYLRSADAYLQHGFIASQELFGRPLISICFATIHQLTGLPLVLSGQLLNSLFYALLCVSFVATVGTLGGDRRVQLFAAMVILSHPMINDHRSSIMRDPAYWAFIMLAFRELLLYTRGPSLSNQLRWLCYVAMASLFRFEGLFFAVLAPLSLLAMRDHPHKFKQCLRLWIPQAIIVGLALAGAIFYKSLMEPGSRLFPAIERYIRKLFSLPDAFAELSSSAGEIMLAHFSREDATLAVVTGLFSVLLINIVRAIMWPWALALLWGWKDNIAGRLRTNDAILLNSHILISLLYLTVFTLISRFMLERYACQIVILILLYIPFILNSLWSDTGRPWKKVLIILVLTGVSVDSLTNSDHRKVFIRDANDWVVSHTPEHASLVTNNKYIAYFSKREIDWDSATRIGFKTQRILGDPSLWADRDYMVMFVRNRESADWEAFLEQNSLAVSQVFDGGKYGNVSIVKLASGQN